MMIRFLDLLIVVLAVLVPLAIAARVMFFQRTALGTEHRPTAAGLAYVIALAAGASVIAMLFKLFGLWMLAQLVLNTVLLCALLASRGNVVNLFRSQDSPQNLITRILRGDV